VNGGAAGHGRATRVRNPIVYVGIRLTAWRCGDGTRRQFDLWHETMRDSSYGLAPASSWERQEGCTFVAHRGCVSVRFLAARARAFRAGWEPGSMVAVTPSQVPLASREKFRRGDVPVRPLAKALGRPWSGTERANPAWVSGGDPAWARAAGLGFAGVTSAYRSKAPGRPRPALHIAAAQARQTWRYGNP